MGLTLLNDLVTIGVLLALLVVTMLTLRATQPSRRITVWRVKQRQHPFEGRRAGRK